MSSGGLDALKAKLANVQAQLAATKKQAEEYRQKADEIYAVYKELKEKKTELSKLKKSFNEFKNTNYTLWKGVLWGRDYKTSCGGVVSSYDTIIGEVDKNMDMLNLERTKYNNMANDCWGIVGQLASVVNSLWAQIQNCLN